MAHPWLSTEPGFEFRTESKVRVLSSAPDCLSSWIPFHPFSCHTFPESQLICTWSAIKTRLNDNCMLLRGLYHYSKCALKEHTFSSMGFHLSWPETTSSLTEKLILKPNSHQACDAVLSTFEESMPYSSVGLQNLTQCLTQGKTLADANSDERSEKRNVPICFE